MKPPACTQSKWGKGTVCEKPTNSAAAKEVKTKLEQLMAERESQDAKWFSVPDSDPTQKNKVIQ